MHIKIFQINRDRCKDFSKIKPVENSEQNPQIESSIYDEVFDGYVRCSDLEEIYTLFNSEYHPLYRGRAMSMSDVVSVIDDVPNLVGRIRFLSPSGLYEEISYTSKYDFEKEIRDSLNVGRPISVEHLSGKNVPAVEIGTYYCNLNEFISVDFDTSKTQKPDNLMRVVYVEPNMPAYEAEIVATLEGEQKAVKGLIEPVYIENDNTCLICNDDSKLIGMEGNRRIGRTIIAGSFFVCGLTEDSFRGLTDEEVTKYMNRFKEPEHISQAEVQADTFIEVKEWNF